MTVEFQFLPCHTLFPVLFTHEYVEDGKDENKTIVVSVDISKMWVGVCGDDGHEDGILKSFYKALTEFCGIKSIEFTTNNNEPTQSSTDVPKATTIDTKQARIMPCASAQTRLIQTILPFYINGASPIDMDDDRWTSLVKVVDGVVVAYCSFYKFLLPAPSPSPFQIPAKRKNPHKDPDMVENISPQIRVRRRIGQFWSVPAWQGQGHAKCLYKAALQWDADAYDEVTVEDPTETFSSLQLSVHWNNFRSHQSIFPPLERQNLSLLQRYQEYIAVNHKKDPLLQENDSLRVEIKKWIAKKYACWMPAEKEAKKTRIAELFAKHIAVYQRILAKS